MTSAGRFNYALGKLCLLANLIDQADAHFGWELPDHVIGINWRNAVKCGQVGVEVGIAYDALVNTIWKDDQLYHYLGDMSPYAYGAALALAYGIDVGEALVRGSYRLYYGEYMPKSENRAYLFTKDFASGVGYTSMLCLSQPDALYLMFEGAKMGGGYVLTYFPDIPVTPEQLAIGAAVVAGAVVVTGIGYYAYNRSWYTKLNNILANAYELSERKNYEGAIKKYKESFAMNPDESTLKVVNRNILAVSNVRLEADIHKICDGKEKLSLQDIRNIISAYDVHLKEVGADETRLNQKQAWTATESLMINLHTAYELQQKNDYAGAVRVYKDCLKSKLDDETTSNIQNNITAVSEQRLLNKMKMYADNKSLTSDDLQQMIDAYNIYL